MHEAAEPRRLDHLDRFWRVLLVIVLVGLGVRVAYVAFAKKGPCRVEVDGQRVGSYPSECARGDQLFYNSVANALAEGEGFVDPLYSFEHPGEESPPTAAHPPLTVVVLAPVSWLAERPPVSWLGGDELDTHVREHRYTMALLGTLLVLLVGLLGRRAGGDTVGWVAAAITAVYPCIWVNDGIVMSETVTGLTVVGAMLLTLRFLDRPGRGSALALGAVSGVAGLARAELVLFVPLLVGGAVVALRGRAWRERMALGALGFLAAGVVIAPWVAYNLSRFEEPTLISTNDGIALAGSNCRKVYYGGALGLTYLQPPCIDLPHPPGDETEVGKVYRQRALDYMSAHRSRLPVVVAARVGRTWSLYLPTHMLTYNLNEGRERWMTAAGLWSYYPVLGLAVAGATLVVRRRAGRLLWVLAAPALVVTVSVAATYGQTRFRAAAEPSAAVFAAVALRAWWAGLRRAVPTAAGPGAKGPLGAGVN